MYIYISPQTITIVMLFLLQMKVNRCDQQNPWPRCTKTKNSAKQKRHADDFGLVGKRLQNWKPWFLLNYLKLVLGVILG